MITLDRGVQLIALQFNFSNARLIPDSIRQLDPETDEEAVERRGRVKGVLVVPPTELCSLSDFIRILGAMRKFELISATYKRCRKTESHRGSDTYHRVRFTYGRIPWVSEWQGLEKLKAGMVQDQLLHICDEALWRVRVYVNPFSRNGTTTREEHALSINLDVRKPFSTFDGEPIIVWRKDEGGNRIGSAPLPLQPDCKLQIADHAITLEKVECKE